MTIHGWVVEIGVRHCAGSKDGLVTLTRSDQRRLALAAVLASTVITAVVSLASASAQGVDGEVTPARRSLVAPPAGGPADSEQGDLAAAVQVTEAGTFAIAAQEVEVGRLLELLAIKSQRNIVASDKVTGRVTVNLYDVPFEQALDAILAVNGFSAVRSGTFIYVYSRQEREEMERASMRREARVFTLQYLSARDATEFIKPLLSEGGSVVARGEVAPGFIPTSEDGGADDYAFTTKVVVNDFVENVSAVETLLKDLDVPPKQVRVEATILRTTVDEANAYGLDFAAIGNIDFAQVTRPLAAFDNILDGTLQPSNAQVGVIDNYPVIDRPPTLKVGIITNDVAIFLRVLDEVTDTTILARPTVTALNRQRAQVLIGEKVAYLSTTQTQTSTTQDVKFLDTGIKLTFRPFISPDGQIRMELHPSVSSARLVDLKVPGGGEATVPNESTQELRTNVRVKSGQTIVLGGLFREDTTINRRMVPWLSDIPLVGALFGGQADRVKREEIIFLLTPTVFEDKQLYDHGTESLDIVDAVRVGARAGLLPFSNDQMVADYQRQALDAFREGDMKRSLFYADNAVRMRTTLPTMVRLREAVRTGDGTEFRKQLDARLSGADGGDPSFVSPPIPLPNDFPSQGFVSPATPPRREGESAPIDSGEAPEDSPSPLEGDNP
ncbi:MAG: secretin and TonB N-terminal domain-containing protein [Phycisphaeraceae bacterium]|nr:secretin and TonB N-terminal domain-containing protein [Phycisphaeraceae bacterium]